MKRSAAWILGAALVIAACAVTALTPSPDTLTGAFLISGSEGEPVSSRNLTAQVQDAVFADRITVEDDEWQADGNWLVVTLAASAPQTEIDSEVRLAKLVVGGREFVASERASISLVDTDLRVGRDTVGMLVFDLPAGLDAGHAELRLSLLYATPHLDDVVVLPLELDKLGRQRSVEIVEPRVEGAS